MKAHLRRARALGGAVAFVVLAGARDSGAQLDSSIQLVAKAWRDVGASVVVETPRFLNEDETILVAVPQLADGACMTMVFLGARGLGFHARIPDDQGAESNTRLPSEAGALSIERCGPARPRRVLVTSDSGRGALEIVAASSMKPLESLRSMLPERTSGATAAGPEPGDLPPLPLPDKRAERAEARARRDGAVVFPRETWPAGSDGAGAAEEVLDPGCHALGLFAVDPRSANPARHKLDLDAELRDASGDRILARDRSDAPDARLELCVGETARVVAAYVGSPANAPVLVTHAAWAIPDRLPTVWSAEGRARMAHVLLTRHVHSLIREPVFLAQGGSGTTPVPIEIEPGGCYLAVASVVQGASRAVNLRMHVGMHDAFDDRGVDDNGAVVAFCAGARTNALAEVEVRGTPLLGWGLALYRMASGVWEIPE